MMKIADLATHPEKYATVGEVAEYFHVTPRYVRKLVGAGTLTAVAPPAGSRLVRITIASVRRAFREPRE